MQSYTGYTRVSQVLELGCAHYGIESIEGIEMFKSLHAIDLSHNFIVDYAPLFKLATYMRWVWLWNTPIRCSDIPILRKNLPYAFLGGIDPFECIPN